MHQNCLIWRGKANKIRQFLVVWPPFFSYKSALFPIEATVMPNYIVYSWFKALEHSLRLRKNELLLFRFSNKLNNITCTRSVSWEG